MKRAAAIFGPTPAFVRWAIRRECKLRQLDCDNLPYETFRQLRSIRELSIGRSQNRVIDGFCIHDEFNSDVKTARGFPANEVFDLFGCQQDIENSCLGCVANCATTETTETWAGCYGWFFSLSDEVNWVEKFETGADCDLSAIPPSSHIWFRVWQVRHWNEPQLMQLSRLLDHVLTGDGHDDDMSRFHNAVKACLDHRLALETELIPRGNSDGLHWIIEPRCSNCSCEMKPDSEGCEECGAKGAPLRAQKKKVLGLRPYMLLTHLVGEETTLRLIEKYHASKSKNVSTSD